MDNNTYGTTELLDNIQQPSTHDDEASFHPVPLQNPGIDHVYHILEVEEPQMYGNENQVSANCFCN